MTDESRRADVAIEGNRTAAGCVRVGGTVGFAALCVTLFVFLAGCTGFDKAYAVGGLAAAGAGVGLLLTLVGGLQSRSIVVEDTHVVAALFLNVLAVAAGLLEMALWLRWPILPAGV